MTRARQHPDPKKRRPIRGWVWLIGIAMVGLVWAGFRAWTTADRRPPSRSAAAEYQPRPRNSLSFHKDIAPILHHQCAVCHRPGQSGPFSLLTYAEVKKRIPEIVEVTGTRTMPPWPPEPGFGHFQDERRLTSDQIGMLRQWSEEGMIEGDPTSVPPLPQWVEGWQLGKPDLILKMPEAYTLQAEGNDVYRNFVLPVAIATRRYVQAMEFHPQNRAVHHASMRLDSSPESRLRDRKDPLPGFGGMDLPTTAATPEGHLLSWQPGRMAYRSPPGLAWSIGPSVDLVLQLHLQTTGKPEPIQCEIGLYFTDQVPTNQMTKVVLRSSSLDIPAGAKDYLVEDRYTLPVDVYAIGLNPHAHYLGKELQGFAQLPGGEQRWLLKIPDWNFKWQGNYTFAEPVFLPKGATLTMRYTYDNSAENPRNPHRPPQRVRYGVQTTDEMAEFWLQLLTRTPGEMNQLLADFRAKELRGIMSFYEHRIAENPRDAQAQSLLGSALMSQGKSNEAMQHLLAAIESDPRLDDPYYFLGLLYRSQKRLPQARKAFENALQLNPDHYKSHGNLGFIAAEEGRGSEAAGHWRAALAIHPGDTLSREALNEFEQLRVKRSLPR